MGSRNQETKGSDTFYYHNFDLRISRPSIHITHNVTNIPGLAGDSRLLACHVMDSLTPPVCDHTSLSEATFIPHLLTPLAIIVGFALIEGEQMILAVRYHSAIFTIASYEGMLCSLISRALLYANVIYHQSLHPGNKFPIAQRSGRLPNVAAGWTSASMRSYCDLQSFIRSVSRIYQMPSNGGLAPYTEISSASFRNLQGSNAAERYSQGSEPTKV